MFGKVYRDMLSLRCLSINHFSAQSSQVSIISSSVEDREKLADICLEMFFFSSKNIISNLRFLKILTHCYKFREFKQINKYRFFKYIYDSIIIMKFYN